MKMPAFLNRLRAKATVPRAFRPARPLVAFELTEDYLAAAQAGPPDSAELGSYFSAAVPAGSVRSHPVHQNLVAKDKLIPLIRAAKARVAPEGAPIALCLPDVLVRTTIISSEELPVAEKDLRELVSWRVKKAIPYRMEDAELAWHVFPRRPHQTQSLVATVIRRRVLQEYEELFRAEGLPVGAVTTSSLALGERLSVTEEGDTMLINVGSGWFSIFILDGNEAVFHRCKPLPESERVGAERDWFVAGEIFPTVEYYNTKLKRPGIKRCVLHLSCPGWEDLHETLRASIDIPDLLPADRLTGLPQAGLPTQVVDRLAAVSALATRSQLRDESQAETASLAGAS